MQAPFIILYISVSSFKNSAISFSNAKREGCDIKSLQLPAILFILYMCGFNFKINFIDHSCKMMKIKQLHVMLFKNYDKMIENA